MADEGDTEPSESKKMEQREYRASRAGRDTSSRALTGGNAGGGRICLYRNLAKTWN